ncbi:MAG: hypothetical protein DRN14_04215 [Thermoplasmata archaeon]|nr:MAG: hypothetical protein DRN14_04215 [Thermoplasmata archaeon]
MGVRILLATEWGSTTSGLLSLGGGVVTHVAELASHLSRMGHEVSVLAGKGDYLRSRGFRVIGLPGPEDPMTNLNLSPFLRRKISDLLKEEEPDVVHGHHIFSRIPTNAVISASRLGMRSLLTTHTSLELGLEIVARFAGIVPWVRRALGASRPVIAVSSSSERLVREICPDAEVVRIPNAVDARRFRPMDPEGAKEALGLNGKVILFVGRVTKGKGPGILLAAAKRIPEGRVVIVGRGHYLPTLRSMVRILGMEGRVSFAGHVSDEALPYYYAASDVVVVPSLRPESAPSVVLEAMASGRPVIASATGGMAEIVEDGRTGILVPAGDVGALSSALETVLGDPDLATSLGKEGRRTVLKKYSWDVVIPKLLELYGVA